MGRLLRPQGGYQGPKWEAGVVYPSPRFEPASAGNVQMHCHWLSSNCACVKSILAFVNQPCELAKAKRSIAIVRQLSNWVNNNTKTVQPKLHELRYTFQHDSNNNSGDSKLQQQQARSFEH